MNLVIFSIDNVDLDEEAQGVLNSFYVFTDLINTVGSRRLYQGIINNINRLEDQTNEDGRITYGLRTTFSNVNPVIIGVWNQDGTQYGQTRTLDEEGNEFITGTSIYPFKPTKYLSLMPDEITYDAEGNMISTKRPTQVYQLKKFAGWGDLRFE